MKQKFLFLVRILSMGLVFAMVFAGCEQAYNGPSADKIADAVIAKQKPAPTADEISDAVIGKQPGVNDIANAVVGKQPGVNDIADAVVGKQPGVNDIADAVVGKQPGVNDIANTIMERSSVSNYSAQIKNLSSYGSLTIGKDITAWGQTDAAYTLTVNTFVRTTVNLPSIQGVTLEGDGTDDIKRAGNNITLAEKSNGKTAAFNFTIANTTDAAKPIKGVLTVNTVFDDVAAVSNINEFFQKALGYKDTTYPDGVNNIANFTLTTGKAIASWGQTDAAYTITADIFDGQTARIYTPRTTPTLYNGGSWPSVDVEWKPPVLAADLTATMNNYSPSGQTTIGGNSLYFSDYSYISYYLSTDSTTAKQATFDFRITSGDKTIGGRVTVNIKKVTKTPAQQQQEAQAAEKAALEQLRNTFADRFRANYYSYDGGIVTSFIDKGISAFGQTDVLYTIAARGGQYNYEYDENSNTVYYRWVDLPYYVYVNSEYTYVTWETKTANAAVVLDSGNNRLKVYTGKSGTAEFSFTYTYGTKTVKGSVKVTVLP
jgi:hypothetical protein